MPSLALIAALALNDKRSCASLRFSTSPAPNVGVGMRKMTLRCSNASSKFGCVSLQAAGAPTAGVTTNRSCTPPSGVPSGFLTKRASRMGPLAERNDGTLLGGPSSAANAICGLVDGLLPPTAGWRWQPEHWLRFILGPNPFWNVSTSWKLVWAAVKNASSFAPSPGSGPPAAGGPGRGPGSVCANAIGAHRTAATSTQIVLIGKPPGCEPAKPALGYRPVRAIPVSTSSRRRSPAWAAHGAPHAATAGRPPPRRASDPARSPPRVRWGPSWPRPRVILFELLGLSRNFSSRDFSSLCHLV